MNSLSLSLSSSASRRHQRLSSSLPNNPEHKDSPQQQEKEEGESHYYELLLDTLRSRKRDEIQQFSQACALKPVCTNKRNVRSTSLGERVSEVLKRTSYILPSSSSGRSSNDDEDDTTAHQQNDDQGKVQQQQSEQEEDDLNELNRLLRANQQLKAKQQQPVDTKQHQSQKTKRFSLSEQTLGILGVTTDGISPPPPS